MIPIRRRSVALIGGFLGWTIFVWGIVRVRNILGDDALSVSERNQALLLSVTFWVPAAVIAVMLILAVAKKSPLSPAARYGVIGLAAWSVLVWLFRAVDIALFSDRGAAFIVVHVVLGVISVVLAWLAVGEVRAFVQRRPSSAA
ncbi:MAG TPA: hypothetical protein VL068_10905 [Microthrixaceae bacterium]|nr:hypothetical protein [Microthrixaceae bacterium]